LKLGDEIMNKKIKTRLQFSGILLSVLIVNSAPIRAMEFHSEPLNTQFRTIEQPLSTKMVVITGGLALIGLELWWFLLSKPKAKKATINQDIQELEIKEKS
jgi:plastocyanin domain-containing protein